MKPILFNTDMVRAILEGRKTVTRRVVKPQPQENIPQNYLFIPHYHPGDTLYVRETWAAWSRTMGTPPALYYKADKDAPDGIKWHPSIHMPREAARIFLRVTDVRVERLQDINYEDCLCEGITDDEINERDAFRPVTSARWLFARLWNSTIKSADRTRYGWEANPWVWVIEFERISREEAVL